MNILLDFYIELNEVRFSLQDNNYNHYIRDRDRKKLPVSLLGTVYEVPLEPEIVEMRSKVKDFFDSAEKFYWVDAAGTVKTGLNPNLYYEELSPFLFGDCSGLSGEINSGLTGDITYLSGRLSKTLNGRIFPSLKGDISGLYGNLGLGIKPNERLTGLLNEHLIGDLSGLRGTVNLKLRGDLSGIVGTIDSKLIGDCSGLKGFISGLTGDCSGLTGRVINLVGDCSNLVGDCTGVEGDCSGKSGDLNSGSTDLRPTRMEYLLNKI